MLCLMNSCPGLSVERRELVSWTETRISPNDIFVHYDPTRRTEGELYYLKMLIPLSICYRVTCYTDITPQHIPFMTPFITRDHYSLYYTIHRRNNQYNSFTSLTHSHSLPSFTHSVIVIVFFFCLCCASLVAFTIGNLLLFLHFYCTF